jgi:hypothetical protein
LSHCEFGAVNPIENEVSMQRMGMTLKANTEIEVLRTNGEGKTIERKCDIRRGGARVGVEFCKDV